MTGALLVGVGGWGKNHARVLHEAGALRAVCDADSALAARFGAEYGVPHYADVSDALQKERFEAAVVATPTKTHAEIAGMLIRAKKHVLLEKPFTYEPAEGRQLRLAAKKAGVVLTCGYIERFNPAVETVRKMVQTDKYGQLVLLELHRENRIPLHIKDVGIIYDTAVHDIDTANWLFGQMPQVVFARSGRVAHSHEDFATIMLGYEGNRTAVIACNWLSPVRSRMFRAAFTGAVVTGDFVTQMVDVNGRPTSTARREPLASEIAAFLEAARSGSEPLVTPHQAVCVSEIAKAALLSGRRGVPIYLDLR